MKRAAMTIGVLLALPVLAPAQAAKPKPSALSGASDEELNVEMAKRAINANRRDLFNKAMMLQGDEATRFWPIYDKYEAEKTVMAMKKAAQLKELAENWDTLTDAQVTKAAETAASNQEAVIATRMKYFRELSKAIGAHKAGRFFQVDDYITTAVHLSVLDNIPLLGDRPGH